MKRVTLASARPDGRSPVGQPRSHCSAPFDIMLQYLQDIGEQKCATEAVKWLCAFMQAAVPLTNAGNRANTTLILIEKGAVAAEYYSANADAIDRSTVFATASLSKWIAAHAVMKLVEQGRLDLDRPVESYLTRWHLPAGAFSSREVTARRLQSHTAGLADGLGFGDYRRDEALPSGEPFETFVTREILQPRGMLRSGYADLASTTNSAKSYDAAGRPNQVFLYASKAATGFTTSAGDMVRWVVAQLQPMEGRPLARKTLDSMRTAQARSMGVDIWGLGTVLCAPTDQGGVVFDHDGVNDPAIDVTVRINPSTGNAIIVLATGSKPHASQLGAEWVFWQTGLPDVLTIPAEIRTVMPALIAGAGGIVFLAFVLVRRERRRNTQGSA